MDNRTRQSWLSQTARATFLAAIAVSLASAAGLPDLFQIQPPIVFFNPTGVGQTTLAPSDPVLFNWQNVPATMTSLSLTGADASDFTLSLGSCALSPSSVPPGQSCSPSLTFAPTALGTRTATMVVQDVGGAEQHVLLVGQAIPPAKKMGFQIPTLAFGDTMLGLPIANAPVGRVQVLNLGAAPVAIASTAITGAGSRDFQIASDACSSTSIPVGSSCILSVAFDPTATGPRRASLEIASDTPHGKQSLPLTGFGVAPQNTIQIYPTAIAFNPIDKAIGESVPLMLSNTGSQAITISGFQLAGTNPSDFSLLSNTCQPLPYTLAVQGQCALDVQFTPAALGPRSAILQVADTAGGSPQTIDLEGSGLKPDAQLSFSPDALAFGLQTVGTQFALNTLLFNQGPGTAPFAMWIEGADAADFSFYENCPSPLATYGSCEVTVAFAPAASGVRTATLMVADTQNGHTQLATLVGSGQPSGQPLSAASPAFPGQPVGQTRVNSLTLSNRSSSALTLTAVALSGVAQQDFAFYVNPCPPGTVLPPFTNCVLGLTFTPSAEGARMAEIDISYTGASAPVAIPLAGVGLPASKTIAFQSPSVTIGPQPIGEATSAQVTVSNTGSQPVLISRISLEGAARADYIITGNGCPLPPTPLAVGAYCGVTVQFTPSAQGARLAQLRVVDDASGSPQSTVLAGFGSSPAVTLQFTPNPVAFTAQPLGSSYQIEMFVSGLPRSFPVAFSDIKVIGPHAADFKQTNDCPSISAVFTGCSVSITFTPSTTGLRTAALQLTGTASDSPQIVPLSGYGLKSARSLTISPVPLTFQRPVALKYADEAILSVANSGTEDILLTGFHIAGAAAKDFGISGSNCPLSPAPFHAGATCQAAITLTPTALGLRMASVSVTDNAPGGTQSVSLVGVGVAPVKHLEANPSSLDFGSVSVGSISSALSVTVFNSGSLPVTMQSIGFIGADPADFSFNRIDCPNSENVLNAGQSCRIQVNFTPASTGSRSAALSIPSDAPNSPLNIPLTGSGQ